MTGKELLNKFNAPIVWGNLLGMALVFVLVCLGATWCMNNYTNHGERIDVPDVTDLLFEDAQAQLEALGLTCVVVDSSFNKNLAPGIIVEQTPKPNAQVKGGREIGVTINVKTEPMLVLPNIILNCSQREAEAQLAALGFKGGPCMYVAGDKGNVLGVKCQGKNINNGDRVPVSSTITLVVGNSEMEYNENEVLYDEGEGLEIDNTGSDTEEIVF